MVNDLSKKEQDVLKIMKDPVLWVTEHIGEPRWYQQLVLRHPHHRILLRMGRRLGKCIAYSQRIMDPETGKYTRIQDLYEQGVNQANIYTLDGKTMKASHSFHIEDNGKKEVFAVKTTDGSEVHLTENHPVLTPEGWKDVGDLKSSDTIALPTSLPYKGSIKKTEEELNELFSNSEQLLEELPKDIYEWDFKVLERFLLTLLSKHRDKRTLETNPSVLLTNIEVAKDLKHLCLRIGVVSTLRREGTSYRLTLLGEHNTDYVFSSLSSVRSIGKQQTYDVHVPETHNLVVEDIFVHNTWTMSSHMLWVAMTSWGGRLAKKGKRGVDILVATPYDVQAKEIYDTLLETIQNNEALSSSIEYNKQGPPREIKFKNGSVIKLFTAGTSSSSDAASIRGQRADFVYLDEADYLSNGDYGTIYPLVLEDPNNTGLMMASTPSGKRGFFYKNSVEEKFNLEEDVPAYNTKQLGYVYDDRKYSREKALGFKEFHFPSMVSPHWNENMEKEMRAQFNSIQYEHEVLAEFGTEMEGVFNKEFVDEASSKEYSLDLYPQNNAPIAIGIDWDKKGAQTNIVVLQYDPHDQRRIRTEMGDTKENTGYGRFKVINHIEVPKAENHYDLAVKKVVELDEIYNPFMIVPDVGAGEYQNEMLRKHIGEKVKPISYGGRIDVRDPISRTIESKPMKPWLVNQTKLLLERGQLRIPSPEVDEVLHRQMIKYRVTKVTENGIPKYSSDDEHALDGMIFALHGFMEQYPELIDIVEEVKMTREFYIVGMNQKDPIKERIKEVSENKDNSNELQTHSSRAKPGITRRRSQLGRSNNTLGWGRRGSTNKKIRNRSF